MFDTMQRSRSRFLVFAVTAAFVISVFPLPRFGNVYVARRSGSASHSKTTLAPAPASNGGGIAVQSISYDMCLQDDSNGSTLSLNTTTGDYIFTCGNCVKKTGRGTLSVKGCTVSLQHNPSDRRVSASLDKCARKGTAALQSPPGTTQCTIRDTNLAAESCSTDLTPPQVNITAPNGGEIVDTGSSFTISWNATDDVAVASQDVLLSTDGGSTWSTIAAGLAGAVNQYAWTAPVIVNNQSVKVRVVARDAACNVSSDNSDANFTVWNPPASFTHSAEAPIYITSGGFDAFIYLCNESMSSIVAELDFRQPLGDATAGAPAQLALSAGDARKIRVADYLTLGSSTGSVEGSIRLRHNGSGDSDVQAMLVVNKFGEEQSFTAPFVYPASSQAADSTMQCSPLFYVDDLMTTSLGLQNCRNYPVDVNVKLVYGTGDPATPNGTLYLPTITLGGQGRLSTNLAAFKAQLQGAKWGSIVVSAPAQSIVAHTVMRSAVKGVACSSSFVDPRISTSTTKVASALKLDYDSLTKPCIMVCNASSTDTRTVTANFQTDSGVPIPSQQVTLAPGQQKMIVVDPRQVLSAHQSAMADVRLTYTGNGSDIVAGGVSMSAAEDYASGARFVEPRSTDGKHLMSPFFRVDARTPGFVQISNLGSSSVMAGVSMKFANSTLPPVTSEMVSVLAGRTATLDVQKYIEQTPDGLTAEGCLSLIHNGAPGTVTCSFVSMTPDPVETPLEPGPPMCHTTVFPNEIDTQAGETTVVRVITCGGQGAVVFTASAGTITPQPSSDPDVSVASYTVPDDESEPDTAIITVTSADGVSTSEVEIQKVKLRSIGTSTGGRLNPDGGTTFVLTGKKDFPTVPLQVRFRKNGTDVSVDIPVGSISGATLTGTAPPNTLFIGDAAVLVFADGGNTKISKKTLCDDTGCSAYYAFDPPTPPTSVSAPGAFNRTGGNLTITAAQGGFRRFDSTIPGAPPILPKVNLDGIGFEVNIVTAGVPATINGNVQRAPKEIPSCAVEGQTPCKFVHVRNPGGRARDTAHSGVALYTVLAGPAPGPQSLSESSSPSIGTKGILIFGLNLDFVERVTFNLLDAPIIRQEEDVIAVVTPPNCVGPATIQLFDVDGLSASLSGFRYVATQPSPVIPVPTFPRLDETFIVGGCTESISATELSHSPMCLSSVKVDAVEVRLPDPRLPGLGSSIRAFEIKVSFDKAGCPSGSNQTATFDVRLTNTADMTLRRTITLTRTFSN